jgi:L-asparaginase
MTGRELVDAVPELSEYADLTVEDVARVPGFEVDAATLETVGERVKEFDDDPTVDAVVVTHGTDTLEETAYYFDVTLQPETPVLVTGAQRRPDEVSADGPANLLAAVRAARAFHERDAGGAFVAFDQTVHSARTATKAHTSKLGTFRSVNTGPVATVDRDGVHVHRPPRSETEHVGTTSLDATVFTVKSGSCVTGDLLDAAMDRDPDGLVVEGTGLGNATPDLGRAIAEAVDADVPVVVASRCFDGRTGAVYGGDGGGERLREHGVVFAGDLPAHKARLKLTLALSADDDRTRVLDRFEN